MSTNETAISAAPEVARRVPVAVGARGVELTTLDELFRFAKYVAASPFAPKGFGSPEAIVAAIQYGYELGLTPMQSLQNICVINGRPSLYGDAMLAVVRASGLLEYITERFEGAGAARRAVCVVKRVGAPTERVTEFSIADAERAGLLEKQGPWQQYPDRMMMFRARGFGLRDEFGDVLKGLVSAEEAMDYPAPERNVTPLAVVAVASDPAPRKRKNAATVEQMEAIVAEARRTGVIAELVARERFGYDTDPEIFQAGQAQTLYGYLRTLPDALDIDAARAEVASDEPVESDASVAASNDPLELMRA